NRWNGNLITGMRAAMTVSGAMRLLVFPEIGGKAHGTLLGRRRVCELTDLRENGGDRSVMSGELVLDVRLELMKPPDKFGSGALTAPCAFDAESMEPGSFQGPIPLFLQ